MRILLSLALLPAFLLAQKPSAERQSYLAHIAAANSAMRLNEPLEIQRWLVSAPTKQRGWEWDFLAKNSDVSLQTHRTTGEKPNNFDVSPDGRTLALPMPNGAVELRDAQTFLLKNTLRGHRKTVYAAVFSPNAAYVATCSRDSTIRCYDRETGQEIWQTPSGGHGLAALAFAPNGTTLAFAAWFRTPERGVVGLIRLLDPLTGRETWRTEFGEKPILGLAFSSDGLHLAAGNWDGQVGVWDVTALSARPKIFDFTGCEGYTAVDDVVFSPDGKTVLAATKCTEPRAWDLETGQQTLTLRGHRQPVAAVAFSRDGRYIFSGGDEGVLHVWEAATGRFLAKQFGHTGRISKIAALPNNSGELLTLSDDQTIRRWAGRNGMAFDDPKGRATAVYAFDRTPDGRTLAMGARQGQIALWDIAADTIRQRLKGFDATPNALAFSPDGNQLIAVNWDNAPIIWDTRSGAIIHELKGLEGGSSGCAWSPDGRFVAAASRKNRVFVWAATTGQLLAALERGAGSYFVQFSPDSKHLVAAGHDGKITVWHTPSTNSAPKAFPKNHEWQAHAKGSVVYSLAFSPDGSQLLSGAEDGTAVVSAFPKGEIRHTLNGHARRIWSVAWSPGPNGRARIATASADLTVCLWDAKTGERTLAIPVKDEVYNLVFSPDGSVLYGNEMSGNVRVWKRF